MKGFILETPRSEVLAGPVKNLSNTVSDTLRGLDPRSRRWCFGIFGGRGTGKTSLLLNILNQLHEKQKSRTPQLVLPKRQDSQQKSSYGEHDLFAPSAHRVEDDLLFLLVGYLFCRYEATSPLDSVRTPLEELEVKRLEIQRFLDYEQSTSPTVKDIPRRMREARRDSATTTQRPHALEAALGGA